MVYVKWLYVIQLIRDIIKLNVSNKIFTCTTKLNIYSMKLVMCYIILHAESIKMTTNTLKLERHNITLIK